MINPQLIFAVETVDGNKNIHKNLIKKLVKVTQRRWKNYIKWIIRKRQALDSYEHEDKNNHKDLIKIERLIKII